MYGPAIHAEYFQSIFLQMDETSAHGELNLFLQSQARANWLSIDGIEKVGRYLS